MFASIEKNAEEAAQDSTQPNVTGTRVAGVSMNTNKRTLEIPLSGKKVYGKEFAVSTCPFVVFPRCTIIVTRSRIVWPIVITVIYRSYRWEKRSANIAP